MTARPGDLTYRPLAPGDAPRLHEIMSDRAVVRQLGSWPWPPDPAFTERRAKPYEGEGFVWGVFEEGALVGSLGVTPYRHRVEIGYAYDLAAAGRGIATRAGADALDHAFAHFDWPQIQATVWHDNPASARVLEKLGFDHWSTRFDVARARGLPTLVQCYRLTRARWHGLRSAAQ